MDDAKETKKGFELPDAETLREIERRQNEKAEEIQERRRREIEGDKDGGEDAEARGNAATIIQRNYRGHRARRALKGYGLDPSTRWLEV